jgi:sulfite exporter TauE/SafE
MRRNILVAVLIILTSVVVVSYVSNFWACQSFCGGITSAASVSVSSIHCTDVNVTCSIELVNSGTASVVVIGCIVSTAGGPISGRLSPNSATVQAPGNAQVACFFPAGKGTGVDTSATGSIQLSNGGSVPWTAVWK